MSDSFNSLLTDGRGAVSTDGDAEFAIRCEPPKVCCTAGRRLLSQFTRRHSTVASRFRSPMMFSDVLILGSGFGGSLLAQILARSGRAVTLVDKARHPRFAIGESSTPLADATLQRLARRYNLPSLLPLTQYGSWKRTYPQLLCGRKRGFTYFRQLPDSDLTPENFADRRLLAAASSDNEHSDTQWLRSDVDQFFFQQAAQLGVHCVQGCRYQLQRQSSGWQLDGTAADQAVQVRADFVVDATGSAGGLLQQLLIPSQTHVLKTSSRAIFAHFADAPACERLLRESGISTDDFPFCCDDAAVHQVLDDGWMWQLRFDDDTVSAGFVIDQRQHSPGQLSPETAAAEWQTRLERYPFLQRQFARATIVRPDTGLQFTGRLQRLTTQAAGADWAVLPNTAGFIDALHSTGIAHTLSGIERLAAILTSPATVEQREGRLQHYSQQLIREIQLVDELVEGCYAALPQFGLWCDWAMLYFAAVTSLEQAAADSPCDTGFLQADNPAFRSLLQQARRQLQTAAEAALSSPQAACRRFTDWLRDALRPWNRVGLLDESCRGLYASTAAPV